MKKGIVVLVLASCLALASFAEGAPAGTFGLFGTIDSSPSFWIGGAYQLTDSIAIKPALGFSYTNEEGDAYKNSFGIRADALFRIAHFETVVLSAGPRVGFTLSKNAADSDNYTTASAFEIGPLMNLQYNVSSSFGVFLDAALLFDFGTDKAEVAGESAGSASTTTISTQTSLGLVFYLK
jgi:hypothetical protein